MHELNTSGPVIGRLRNRDIVEWYVDNLGRKFIFDRAASADQNGGIELAQLRDDEQLRTPGLIYRFAGVVATPLAEVHHAGHCSCGRAVTKLENASGSGDIYRYPESISEPYEIFSCRSCKATIASSWQADNQSGKDDGRLA